MIAVVEFRNKEGDLGLPVGDRHDGLHPHGISEVTKGLGDGRGGELTFVRPFDALKEDPLLLIAMLIGMNDITGILKDPPGDFGDDSGVIGAVEQGDEIGGRLGGHGKDVGLESGASRKPLIGSLSNLHNCFGAAEKTIRIGKRSSGPYFTVVKGGADPLRRHAE